MAPNPQRAAERRRTAEAEAEPARDEFARLLLGAVECMRNAAGHLDPAQVFQQPVGRAAHVHDDRQRPGVRQPQLRLVEVLLAPGVGRALVEVQTDLADPDEIRIDPRRSDRFGQPTQIRFPRLRHVQRMNPQRVAEAEPVRDAPQALELAHLDRRNQHHLHAGGLRPFDDLLAVGVELLGVQMAVAVDPHLGASNRRFQ